MYRKFLPLLLAAALVLSACSLRISIPITQTTGPTTTDRISIPLPDTDGTVHLNLAFGAGTLNLSPGAANLVDGTAAYNVPDLKPEVTTTGSVVRIEQGDYQLTGIPDLSNLKNEWNLQLGGVPLDLEIAGGAYTAEYALGGLALVNLTIRDGASRVTLSFDEPNAAEMNLLRYETGASNVSMIGLANANFASMEFASGAGNYTLDFSGELKRAASVMIETGVSNLTLVIPEGIPVQITVQGALANVAHGSGWNKDGSVYTQTGEGPGLVIVIEIGAGNLTITR
ncbi:MAG: hypothetical protein FD146_1534 [Anaerolineaceae bacterium]|nr:MAG: hypothetical protein FD146_1534 [Anaerolineaceae bacterium]